MEYEKQVKIKFIRQRGQCPPGYEAEFSSSFAEKLIKDGYAEAVKLTLKITPKKAKSKDNSKTESKED